MLPRNTQTIGYNKWVLDIPIKYLYAYKRTIDTIENLCVIVVGSIPRERSTSHIRPLRCRKSDHYSVVVGTFALQTVGFWNLSAT